MIARAASAVLLLVVAIAAACPRQTPLPDVSDLTPETARLRLQKEGERRRSAAAVVKARSPGLSGVVASADLDVVVEAPDRLLLAVRSFFEQPMQILAADGERATLFDATSEGGPRWFEGPITERTLAHLLPIPIGPDLAVPLFLGSAPAAGARARNLEIDAAKRTYSVELEGEGGRRAVVTARLDDDVLTSWLAFTPDGRRLLLARYGDVRDEEGVPFAHRIEMTLYGERGEERVVLEARDVDLNPPPFPVGSFRLAPPAGQAPEPLPGSPRGAPPRTEAETTTPELGAEPGST